MKNKNLKSFVVPFIYLLAITSFLTSVYFLQKSLTTRESFEDQDTDSTSNYVYETPSEYNPSIPVISGEETMIHPFMNDKVEQFRGYYDYQASADLQEKALIFFENIYMQNSGVDYIAEESFNVVATFSGEVTSVKDDGLLGWVIELVHDNDVITIYQSLGEVYVNEGDTVDQGDIIGKSGQNSIDKEQLNHLHYEVIRDGFILNPSECFNKKLDEF